MLVRLVRTVRSVARSIDPRRWQVSAAQALWHHAVSSHFQCIWLPICTAEHRFSRSQLCCFYRLFIATGTGREYAAHLHLKPYTPNQVFFRHTPKMTFSSCYNKWSVGYFGLKLHRHILGTPKVNITSCKKGHNRCPLNKCWNFLSWFLKKNIKNKMFSTLIMTRNVSWEANRHIMIFEGSCDTEAWSNDAENSTLHHRNKLHFTIYSQRKQLFLIIIIFHNITIFTVFTVKQMQPWWV